MYDTYEPFQDLNPIEFNFSGTNYKIWEDAKIIKQGKSEFKMICSIDTIQHLERMVCILDNTLENQIKQGFVFDKAITSNDRILLLALPEYSNHEQIQMLTSYTGPTRPRYNFERNEPYSCSIFATNGNIVKLSINLYNYKLIELYK